MKDFRNEFSSEESMNNLFKETMIMVRADSISRNLGQKDRFILVDKDHFVLFQNQYRRDLIEGLRASMGSGRNRSKVTGAKGVGKSHLLALFTLRSRVRNLRGLTENQTRILYINDPEVYFGNFQKIRDDIAYFMENYYLENDELRQGLTMAVKFCDCDAVLNFIRTLLTFYQDLNIKYELVIDQYNNLEKRNWMKTSSFSTMHRICS